MANRRVASEKAVPTSAYLGPSVTLEVGQPAQSFTVHKDLLCHYSTFFQAALNGSFKEAQEGKVVLVDEEPRIAGIAIAPLYSGRLYEDKEANLDGADLEKTTVSLSEADLVKLWLFGDRRGITLLQNKVIDTLHRFFLESWYHDLDCIKMLWL